MPEVYLSDAVRMYARACSAMRSLATLGCDEPKAHRVHGCNGPPNRSTGVGVQACVSGVGATHMHPSWRSFVGIPLQPVAPDRYETTFADVPVKTRVSFRVNDQNACDENPTGAVTWNVLVNDVRLIQNTSRRVALVRRSISPRDSGDSVMEQRNRQP